MGRFWITQLVPPAKTLSPISMASNDYVPRPQTVEVSHSELNTLKGNVARERRKLKQLSDELGSERGLAQRALEETLAARKERDEYRRVLAAAMKGEHLANERRAELEMKLGELENTLNQFVAEASRADGRNKELGARLHDVSKGQTEAIEALREELRSERERFERELSEANHARGTAQGRVYELERRLEQDLPATMRMARLRSFGIYVAAAVVYALAIAFIPPLFRAMFGSDSPETMQLAVGMSGWAIFLLECVLLGVGYLLVRVGMSEYQDSVPR